MAPRGRPASIDDEPFTRRASPPASGRVGDEATMTTGSGDGLTSRSARAGAATAEVEHDQVGLWSGLVGQRRHLRTRHAGAARRGTSEHPPSSRSNWSTMMIRQHGHNPLSYLTSMTVGRK
jgi:hypothetical protein